MILWEHKTLVIFTILSAQISTNKRNASIFRDTDLHKHTHTHTRLCGCVRVCFLDLTFHILIVYLHGCAEPCVYQPLQRQNVGGATLGGGRSANCPISASDELDLVSLALVPCRKPAAIKAQRNKKSGTKQQPPSLSVN